MLLAMAHGYSNNNNNNNVARISWLQFEFQIVSRVFKLCVVLVVKAKSGFLRVFSPHTHTQTPPPPSSKSPNRQTAIAITTKASGNCSSNNNWNKQQQHKQQQQQKQLQQIQQQLQQRTMSGAFICPLPASEPGRARHCHHRHRRLSVNPPRLTSPHHSTTHLT